MVRLKIALLLGNKPNFNIYAFKYFILSLNKLQKTYEFSFPTLSEYYIPNAENEAKDCITIIKKAVEKNKVVSDYSIAIIRSSIRNDYFAWPEYDCAVITTNHWEKYFAPPSLFEYLLNSIYYCLFSSHVKQTKKDRHDPIPDELLDPHNETIGCLFDFAENRFDNRIYVALGYICDNHKKELIDIYGQQYVDESLAIIERNWIGNLEEKDTVAYNLKHNFKFDIYKDSGWKKSFWDLIKDKFYEIPGSLVNEGLKIILIALMAALLLLLGLDYKK
jgi:hypothetical protein